jgi:8-hydroxy-5-deazaflavin:NADPH oxidoreductase
MFFCGDDREANAVMHRLGEDLGFEMIDAGPLAMLWIHLAVFEGLGPSFAFKLLRR